MTSSDKRRIAYEAVFAACGAVLAYASTWFQRVENSESIHSLLFVAFTVGLSAAWKVLFNSKGG